ncbi:hypothetical protein [Nocardioides yefusunii]|uniref:Pyrroloquinoline-quinone binding quinoprotein n=1 Tax=Nocardioides yefusunii TaxID=2500546 RepID=A0ABW1QWV0_9ACTN|nr:hypothetical protein [Nocardioides yefusunii]
MGWALICLLVALYVAVGPWGLVAAAALLLVPQIRERVPRPRLTRKGVGIGAAVVVAVSGIVVVLPDGFLSVPTAGGLVVLPGYEGRQQAAKPLETEEPAQHPWVADYALHNPGPLGDAPVARSGWYGLEGCRNLKADSRGRIVAICNDPRSPVVRVIDAKTLRSAASKRLPGVPDTDDEARAHACDGTHGYLDNGDRLVMATTDQRILAIGTADANGDPDLTVDETWNLNRILEKDDCLVTVAPDWSGKIWFAALSGRVGVLDPVAGGAQIADLGARVTRQFAVDEQGVYVTSDEAVHRLDITAAGVQVGWTHRYERGVEVKSGQFTQGSGSGPTLVDGDLLAFTDNAEPRMRVVFLDRSNGSEVCSAGVFDGGESSTDTPLVSTGSGVVVVNDHGAESTASTFWGFATAGGLARVDQKEGTCTVTWRSDVSAPDVRPVISWRTGQLYTYAKRPTLWGVPAWYLVAIDAESGRTSFTVRGGTGRGLEPRESVMTLDDSGQAFVGVVGGLVRVRDRVRD